MQEDLQQKVKQVEKLEKLMKQQACEVTKANGIIKQLQKELKVTHNKVCTSKSSDCYSWMSSSGLPHIVQGLLLVLWWIALLKFSLFVVGFR